MQINIYSYDACKNYTAINIPAGCISTLYFITVYTWRQQAQAVHRMLNS